MKWTTTSMIHFDRVASAWLILRFVDRNAEFVYFEEGESAPVDATPFGVPGAALSSHDREGTTFQRILASHSIADAALERMAMVIAAGVNHVLNDPRREPPGSRDPLMAGLLAVTEGNLLVSLSDEECLRRNLPVYDALYARLQAQLQLEAASSATSTVLGETILLSRAARRLRGAGAPFSAVDFGSALERPGR